MTHDLAVVANLADRIAVMYAGRLVEIGPKEALFAGAWHPYTRKLLAAIPDLSGRARPARHPRLGAASRAACRRLCLHAALRLAIERCATEYPPYEGTEPRPSGALLALGGGASPRPLEIGGRPRRAP